MSALKYHRPQTMEQALELLAKGIPLAGGVGLTPRRRSVEEAVDLQDLGLDMIEIRDGRARIGAAASLEQLRTAPSIPPALAQACRHEAALNVRNQATIGGLVHAADGRSPLLTALLSLRCTLQFAGNDVPVELDPFLEERGEVGPRLMTGLVVELPAAMAFESIGRSPLDRPVVCAAAARYDGSGGGDPGVRLSLGGFGSRPFVGTSEPSPPPTEALSAGARDVYADAGDAWATAAYRSDVAGVLGRRLVAEVMN